MISLSHFYWENIYVKRHPLTTTIIIIIIKKPELDVRGAEELNKPLMKILGLDAS